MPSIITSIGEATIVQKQIALEPLQIATVKFFNVQVGGGNPTVPSQSETEPAAQYLVHQASITYAGVVNPNAVIYSVMLDANVGNFVFTWIGWYTAEGILFAITHTTPQYKTRTEGPVVGNNFTRNLLFPYTGAQQLTGVVVPAQTWQLNFTERFETGERELRKANRVLYGRFAVLKDAFKITALPLTIEDECEATTDWALTGGSGTIDLDAIDFYEGTHSLKVSGQIADAELVKTVSSAPRNWSLKNGVTVAIKGDLATNIAFFIEDGQARRNKWNLVNQTAWTEYEFKLSNPDINGNCDYADVCKFGIEGLDSGVSYWIDAIKTHRFNDFAIESGQAFLEGIRLEQAATTYRNHRLEYTGEVTAPEALTPPMAGTRTDSVYLDVHIQGDFNTIAPYLTVKVSDQSLTDYVDGNGYQHYMQKIAEIERSTSQLISASMLTDLCHRLKPDESILWDATVRNKLYLILLATLNGENRLVAGSYNTVTGVLENVQVKFVVDGTLSLMNFPNTPVIINPIHQIWCANIISGIISPLTLDNFAQMISSAILTVNNFPILYTGYTHTNPAPFFQIIAVRNHNTLSQIRLDSPKINEDSVLLATSTELNQLNGIVIGGYAADDVVNIGGI